MSMSILALNEQRQKDQWYQLADEAVMTAADLKKKPEISLVERTFPKVGTIMYLRIAGTNYRVSNSIAEDIRAAGGIDKVEIEVPSITVACLDKTDNCTNDDMPERIYRANFAWA